MAELLAARLLAIFGAFGALILFFAWLYLRAYRRDRNSFAFNFVVVEEQKKVTLAQCQRELSRLSKELGYFQMLQTALKGGTASFLPESAPQVVFLSSGLRFEFRQVGGTGTVPIPPAVWIDVIDANENRECLLTVDWFAVPDRPDRDDFLYVVDKGIADRLKQSAGLERQVESLTSDLPHIWGYRDFCYFSTLVQTTVGLGDILPNSPGVRALVAVQALVGYVVIALVLAFILSWKPN